MCERTGLDADQVVHLWRTLGYPVPRPDEVAFTDADVEILTEIGHLLAGDVASGRAGAADEPGHRLVDGPHRLVAGRRHQRRRRGRRRRPPGGDAELTDERIVVSAAALLPIVPRVLAATWRRHLQAAIRAG